MPADVEPVLDKWVQLRGSGTLSASERQTLARAIATHGEKAPKLYRGVNMKATAKTFQKGQAIDFGPVSASEDQYSAAPYAESGDDQSVLFVLDGAKGLNVQNRAEESAGFGEQEWITSGRFYVQSQGTDEDGNMLIRVGPRLGSDPVSQKNAGKKPLKL